MSIDWPLLGKVVGPILLLLFGALIDRAFRDKPNLLGYLIHAGAVSLPPGAGQQQATRVQFHSIVLVNSGRKAAANVTLGHNMLPSFEVFPPTAYETRAINGGQQIVFSNFPPKKQITITYLYFHPLTFQQVNTTFESDDGPVKILRVLPTRQYPRWFNNSVLMLCLIGLLTTIYLLMQAVLSI